MKAWRPAIEGHITDWAARLPPSRRWWPRHVYHFTNIVNAVNIVQRGALLSREEAQALGLMGTDNASASVIANTRDAYRRYARLYFRPRTPTQYHNEGIRPRAQRSLGAHCAVPVFFFFDALSVLALDETRFSDGNIASPGVTIDITEDFFRRIPFADVFSDGGMGQVEQRIRELTLRRSAEVLVPNKLLLDPHLQLICCRSAAERQTFLHMLGGPLRGRWEGKVRVASDPIFERRATYVEAVSAAHERVQFTFNPASRYRGPFDLRFEFVAKGRPAWALTTLVPELGTTYSLRLLGAEGVQGVATLKLDDDIAFNAPVEFTAIPF